MLYLGSCSPHLPLRLVYAYDVRFVSKLLMGWWRVIEDCRRNRLAAFDVINDGDNDDDNEFKFGDLRTSSAAM